jgi:hypothetical protein
MRIKKSIVKKPESSRKKLATDLDPTTNPKLHMDIWLRLKQKIARESQR